MAGKKSSIAHGSILRKTGLSQGAPVDSKQLTPEELENLVLNFLAEPIVDFRIENHGSIVLLRPLSQAAKDWVEENVSDEGSHPSWPTLVCEPRYISSLLYGIHQNGLTIAGWQ